MKLEWQSFCYFFFAESFALSLNFIPWRSTREGGLMSSWKTNSISISSFSIKLKCSTIDESEIKWILIRSQFSDWWRNWYHRAHRLFIFISKAKYHLLFHPQIHLQQINFPWIPLFSPTFFSGTYNYQLYHQINSHRNRSSRSLTAREYRMFIASHCARELLMKSSMNRKKCIREREKRFFALRLKLN